jgi:hypothetical protein
LQGRKIGQAKEQRESKEGHRFSGNSYYVGRMKGMENNKSIPVGSLSGHNEPLVPIGSQT